MRANRLKSTTKGAVIGGMVGALFHLAWHLSLPLSVLSQLLWEWGGIFAGTPRFELFGLHLFVLMIHVSVYAVVGALISFLMKGARP